MLGHKPLFYGETTKYRITVHPVFHGRHRSNLTLVEDKESKNIRIHRNTRHTDWDTIQAIYWLITQN